jgi:ring-1,2-phenylacetyl-CoA epoxidase subunit PaaE
MSEFHELRISEVRKETPNAVSISFEIPEALKQTFSFKAGQYITIKHIHQGEEIRRAYSVCSSAGSNVLRVGVKKVIDGSFSQFANTALKAGDFLEVMPPQGKFILTSNPNSTKNYVAFAAGSGITPVLSIITTALEEEPRCTFSLIYGNRSMEETMFASELLSLKERFPDRFFLEFIFSRKKEETGLFGRIERSTVNYLLKHKFGGRDYDTFYLCGPEAMIHAVTDILLEKGVEKKAILFELFTTSNPGTLNEVHDGFTEITVTLDDETETFIMPQTSSVLDAVLKHGMDAPFSCQGGICSTCIARMSGGKAEMRKNQILTDAEIEEGLVLTCQAHPSSPSLKIDYDDV